MTLQKKKSRDLEEALRELDLYCQEISYHVREGYLTPSQAEALVEDRADQLGL